MTSETMTWRFRKVAEGEKHRNPPHEYLFQPGEGDSTEPLVREVVQNSMDARSKAARKKSRPVELRFRLIKIPSFKEAGMQSLRPHLLAEANGLDSELVRETLSKDALDALIIEDFHTTGLLGPIDSSAPTDDDKSKYGYFYFAHAEGESGKGAEDQGSWGLGKQVLPQSSVLNTFFAWTIRDVVQPTEPKQVLFGQCIVKYHRVGDVTYAPDGFFGLPDALTTPITDPASINKFRKTVSFDRRDEPGLSVLVPGLREGFESNKIIKVLIRNYYYSFLKEKLAVTVMDDSEPTKQVLINRETIAALADRYFPKDENKAFDALRRILHARQTPELLTQIQMKPIPYSNYRVDLAELIDKSNLMKAEEAWDTGGIVHLPVLMEVQGKADGKPTIGRADLYLIKQKGLGRSKPGFYRDGLHISDISVRYTHRDLLAVMFAESESDNPLGLLLRESENPAHTDWMTSSPKARNTFYYAKPILQRIRRIPAQFPQAVKALQETENRSALASIFPKPIVGGELKGPSTSKRRKSSPPDTKESEKFDAVIESSRPKSYNLSKTRNGFRVRHIEETEEMFPRILTVTVAYDMIGGDPFKNYKPFDFDFTKDDEIQIESSGDLERRYLKENSVRFLLRNPNFDIQFSGFDIHRDIKVKASSRKEEEEEEVAHDAL